MTLLLPHPEHEAQRLVVHRRHPLNCETSIPALTGGTVPNAQFYVRNHFAAPAVNPATWRLRVRGLVKRPLSLSLHDLQAMPLQTQVVTLECAGNGRSLLDPRTEGEQWGLGAVSTAEWTGLPLAAVLDRAGVHPSARHLLFRGADRGTVGGRPATIRFERSLSLGEARDAEPTLAYAMNGEPLPVQHGYPLRLVVPGWYGVASVKWLTEIEVRARPFDGYFQVDRYRYEREAEGRTTTEPVTLQRVRALITQPAAGQEVKPGQLTIRGLAWSGAAPILRVQISLGGGPWATARLLGPPERHRWQWWELITATDRPGPVTVRARATDRAGRTQPDEPEWNRLGYGANPVQHVPIHITGGSDGTHHRRHRTGLRGRYHRGQVAVP
jgi:DMSO/TMAO reductase YedYZ molybdopterin-dependent catalytic subunit